MPRVADSELRTLVEARSDEALMPYIEDASLLINETLGTSSGLSEDRLKLLEKYLAAHFWVVAQEKGGLTLEKRGEASMEYQKYTGEGLSSTRFGRQVITFDATGELDKVLSGVKKAQFRLA